MTNIFPVRKCVLALYKYKYIYRMPEWLDNMKAGWEGDASEAIEKWFEEAADTSRNPLLIIDIDDYNKPVLQFIIGSLIKSWAGPNEKYIKGAIEHLTKWYSALSDSQKRDEFFMFSIIIELYENYNCRLDIEYDNKPFLDLMEDYMGDFFFNFKKEYLQSLKFQDYFLYGLNSDVTFQVNKCAQILNLYGVDAKLRAAGFNLKHGTGVGLIKAIRALDAYIETVKMTTDQNYQEHFTKKIQPLALLINKSLSEFKAGDLVVGADTTNYTFGLTETWTTDEAMKAEVANKSELLTYLKTQALGSEEIVCTLPEYRNEDFPERMDSPIEFLKNLIASFPKLKRDKLDSLKEIYNENLSLLDKAFEYENFNEVCFLDLLIAMVYHLSGYNALYENQIENKLTMICQWLVDYPFKRLNAKSGELIDKGFFLGFVDYYDNDLNVNAAEGDSFEEKSKRLFQRCMQLLVFLMKLRTAKRYNETGFENMSMFCDNFDRISSVDLAWSDNAMDLEEEVFTNINIEIRSVHFRRDINFMSGFTIRGTPILKEFWACLDNEIYFENTKMPMSYFLALLSTEKGECEMDDESFLNCLQGAFNEEADFNRFVTDPDVEPLISAIKMKITNYKSSLIPDVIGPPVDNLGSLNKMTYIYTESIFKKLWGNITSINQIADMSPSASLDEVFKTQISAFNTNLTSTSGLNIFNNDGLKEALGLPSDEEPEKLFINIYNTCELLYYHALPSIVAWHGAYFSSEITMKADSIVEKLSELYEAANDKSKAQATAKFYGSMNGASYETNFFIILQQFLKTLSEFFSRDVNKSDKLSYSERMELILNSPLTHFLQVPKELIRIDVNNLSQAGIAKRIGVLLGYLDIKDKGAGSNLYVRNENHNVFREILHDKVEATELADAAAPGAKKSAQQVGADGPVNMEAIDDMIEEIQKAINKKRGEMWEPKIRIEPPFFASKKENILHVTQIKYLLHYIYLNLLPFASKIQSYLSMVTGPRTLSKGGIKDILQWNVDSNIPTNPANAANFELLLDFKDSKWAGGQSPKAGSPGDPVAPVVSPPEGGAMKGGACDLSALNTKISESKTFIDGLPKDDKLGISAGSAQLTLLNYEFNETLESIDLHFKLLDEKCSKEDLSKYSRALEKPSKRTAMQSIFSSIFKSIYYIYDKRSADVERKLTTEEEYPIKQASDCFILNMIQFLKTAEVVVKTLEDSSVRNDDFIIRMEAGLVNLNYSDGAFMSMKYQTSDYAIKKNTMYKIADKENNLWVRQNNVYNAIILTDGIKAKQVRWAASKDPSTIAPILAAVQHILQIQAFRILLNIIESNETPNVQTYYSKRDEKVNKIKAGFIVIFNGLVDVASRRMLGHPDFKEMNRRNAGAKAALFNADPSSFNRFFVEYFSGDDFTPASYSGNSSQINLEYKKLMGAKTADQSALYYQRKKHNVIALDDKPEKWMPIANDEIVSWVLQLVKTNVDMFDLAEHLYPTGAGGPPRRPTAAFAQKKQPAALLVKATMSEEVLAKPLPNPDTKNAKIWCDKFINNFMRAFNWLWTTSETDKGLRETATSDLLIKGGALETDNAGIISTQIGNLITNNLKTAEPNSRANGGACGKDFASTAAPQSSSGGSKNRLTRKFKRRNYSTTFHKRV